MRRRVGRYLLALFLFVVLVWPIVVWATFFLWTSDERTGDWVVPLVAAVVNGLLGVYFVLGAKTPWRFALTVYYVLSAWLAAFTFIYWELGDDGFNETLSRLDATYFAMTVATTTGFGDVSPISPEARGVVTAQMATGFVLVIFGLNAVVSRLVGAGSGGHGRRAPQDPN